MKKYAALLAAVSVFGLGAAYMLERHPDMQVQLATSYEQPEEAGSDPVPETKETDKFEVRFSQKKTFYNEDIEVKLTCTDENAVIYYTDDGNTPTEKSKKYSSPLRLTAQSREKCTTIKAFAVSGGKKTDVTVKSYIVGRNVKERFDDDTLVFVLSADEYDLYDYYNGIAVEGYLRDEYLRNEYDGGELIPTDPANYNIRGREGERPMYVEVYNSEGDRLISQASGARVVGGYSRAVDQKSWRLIARNEYSEGNGKFSYPFFTENTDINGSFLTKYDRITLRNGANDREFAGVRDELSMTLAFEAGFPDAQAVRPAAVYLNGEYYGYAWLHEAYCEDYLEMMYGGSKENFRIVGSKELEVESDNEEDEKAVADWQHVIDIAEKDLTMDLYFSEFCDLVDIDDLMMYYAMQVYIDNKDWPGNNFKVWRYYPAKDEKVTSGYLDGRWRFLYFDAEFAWGLYGNGYSDDTLYEVISGDHMQGASHILAGLLKRKDMREKFANTLSELEAGVFEPKHVNETLDRLIAESDKEQIYALENGYVSEWANKWSFEDSRQQIRDFANYRSVIMDNSLREMFGYGKGKYTVEFRAPTGADIKAGCMLVESGKSASVQYFSECSSYLTALPYDGYSVDHWEINGNKYTGSAVKLTASMADSSSKKIKAALYLKKTGSAGTVAISELYTAGKDDRVVISDTTGEPVQLKGWYLSDKKNDLKKYVIPELEIPAGESAVIVMKDNKDKSSLMKHQTDFSLRPGETVYLTSPEGTTVSSVPVLDLTGKQHLVLGANGRYSIVS